MCFNKIVDTFLLILTAVYFWSCNLKFQESKSEILNEQPHQLTGGPYRKSDPAWSPDGSKIAYSVLIGATELSTFSLTGKGTVPLARIEDDSLELDFTISPDGTKICFASFSRGHLWIYDFATESETILTPSHVKARNPDWSPDGSVIAFSAPGAGENNHIWIIPASGGAATQITQSDSNDTNPAWSPKEKQIVFESEFDSLAFIKTIAPASGQVFLISPDSISNHNPDWSPDDSTIVYHSTRNDTTAIWAFSFRDSSETKITNMSAEATNAAWSPDGACIACYTPEGITVVSPAGEVISLTLSLIEYPVWMPVHNSLLATKAVDNSVIEVYSFDEARSVQVTEVTKSQNDYKPAWFPDNETIAFVRQVQAKNIKEITRTIWTVKYPGTTAVPFFAENQADILADNPAVSPDGTLLVFDGGGRMFLSLTATRQVVDLSPFIGFDKREPSWSPAGDGFICNGNGQLKIFSTDSSLVIEQRNLPFDVRNPAWSGRHPVFGENIAAESFSGIIVISNENPSSARTAVRGGFGPSWSPDASMLAYELNGQIYTLRILLMLPE